MTSDLVTIESQAVAEICDLPAHQNPVSVFLAGHTARPATYATYLAEATQLGRLAGFDSPFDCPWHTWEAQWFTGLFSARARSVKFSALIKTSTVLRGIIRACWKVGLIDSDHRDRCLDLPKVKGESAPRGRSLDVGEIRALHDACRADLGPAGSRDATILLALGLGQGLRRSEMIGLDLEDYNEETGELKIKHAKGGRERSAWLVNGAALWMAEWLERRGDAPGALLCPVDKAGRVSVRPITSQAVFKICQKRGSQAQVPAFSPHDLRRTCVSMGLDSGIGIDVVSQIVGHKSVVTTMRYDKRGEKVKLEGSKLLHVPYQPAA